MRRKYFMRGMGFGIIVTALIFSVMIYFKGTSISNSEIIEKAKELGMVMGEPNTMSGSQDQESATESKDGDVTIEEKTGDEVEPAPNETTDPITEANGGDPTPTNPANPTTPTNPESTTGPQSPTKPTASNETTDTSTGNNGNQTTTSVNSGNIVKFRVREGDSSAMVGANLYKAGLIDNPNSFDRFLENNGYDKVIHVGEYEIRTGSQYETIAKIITGR